MKITVVGLGKIGLPLAVQFASGGHVVYGADIAPSVVAAVSAGIPPFPGEHQLPEKLAEAVASRCLLPTTDTVSAVETSDVVVVVVPLSIDSQGSPVFDAVDSATRDIARGLQPGTLVLYETTLPVGTTRTRLAPMLESSTGLRPGVDFFLAFSPERVYSGRVFADLARYPKLVGGVDEASAQRAIEFYSKVLSFDERPELAERNGVWDMGSPEAAELAKLAETTYRDVNIALANQFALYAQRIGVDIHQVIEACNSQPFSHLHRPGIAVGGHCLPVYSQIYAYGDPHASVTRAAREANAAMPSKIIDLLEHAAGGLDGRRALVLGAAYRGGVKEAAFSGVFATAAALRERRAEPLVHDPLFTPEELTEMGLTAYRQGESVDCVVVQADHSEYRNLSSADIPGVKTVFDGRGVLDPARWADVDLLVLGRIGH
ncbi:nucleotide sugar dehydrogenase [Saccharopolyspora hattusasensis]|uniref:nucleotide sugar dehydrogenase n=1 Tax=Saccharopolyspora hattusasensis TaxID=1128679 RepID=UPI003D95500F